MKKIIGTVFAAIILPGALLLGYNQAAAQTVVKIGDCYPVSNKHKEKRDSC